MHRKTKVDKATEYQSRQHDKKISSKEVKFEQRYQRPGENKHMQTPAGRIFQASERNSKTPGVEEMGRRRQMQSRGEGRQ